MGHKIEIADGFDNNAASRDLCDYISIYGGDKITPGEGDTGAAMSPFINPISYSMLKWSASPISGQTWITFSFNYRKPNYDSQTVVFIGNRENDASTTSSRMNLYIGASRELLVRSSSAAQTPTGKFLDVGQWYHIEYRHRYGNGTTGNWALKVNGGTAVTGVGDNSGVVPAWVGFGGGNPADHFDDLVVSWSNDPDPTWFGPLKVHSFKPTGTSSGQWMGSDGNTVDNHLLVDDGDPTVQDWVTATAGTGLRDLYTHAGAPSGVPIHGVRVRGAGRTDVAGPDNFDLLLQSGGSTVAERITMGTGSPIYYATDVLQTDPATGAAWTKTGFDATQFGIGAS